MTQQSFTRIDPIHQITAAVLCGDWSMVTHITKAILIHMQQNRTEPYIMETNALTKVLELQCKYQQQQLMEIIELHGGSRSLDYLQQCHQVLNAMKESAPPQQQASLQHLVQNPDQLPHYKQRFLCISDSYSVQFLRSILAHDISNTLIHIRNSRYAAQSKLQSQQQQQRIAVKVYEHPHSLPQTRESNNNPVSRTISPVNSVVSSSSASDDQQYARPLKKRRYPEKTTTPELKREPKRQKISANNSDKERNGSPSTINDNSNDTKSIKPMSKLLKLGITSTPTLRKRLIKVLIDSGHNCPMVWEDILSKVSGNRAKIWSTLCLFVNARLVNQTGKGRRGLPFKYALAEYVTESHFMDMEMEWERIDAEGKRVHKALQEEKRLLKRESKKNEIDRKSVV